MSDPSFTGQIPFFLQSVLGKPASALPKNAQWILQFTSETTDTDVIPIKAITAGISYEPNAWSITKALNMLVKSEEYQKTKGCMFVQAVQIPGEGNQVNVEGVMSNGFIRGAVGAGREAYNGMQVVFLETNVSFVDNVIRPWTIATSHLGMIARTGDLNYRGKIIVYKLGTLSPNKPPVILQKYTFHGVCPITIDGEEYNYSPSTGPTNRNVTFTYYYYTLDSIDSDFKNENIAPPSISVNSSIDIPVRENITTRVTTAIPAIKKITAKESTAVPAAKTIPTKESTTAPATKIINADDLITLTPFPLIIPFNFITPILPPLIYADDIITQTLPPLITSDTIVTTSPTPIITADTETTTVTVPAIEAENNFEIPKVPIITAEEEAPSLNKLVRENILNPNTSSSPAVQPIILNIASRANANPAVVL